MGGSRSGPQEYSATRFVAHVCKSWPPESDRPFTTWSTNQPGSGLSLSRVRLSPPRGSKVGQHHRPSRTPGGNRTDIISRDGSIPLGWWKVNAFRPSGHSAEIDLPRTPRSLQVFARRPRLAGKFMESKTGGAKVRADIYRTLALAGLIPMAIALGVWAGTDAAGFLHEPLW